METKGRKQTHHRQSLVCSIEIDEIDETFHYLDCISALKLDELRVL